MKTRALRIACGLAATMLSTTCLGGDRLLATGGAHMIEGAGGGGIVPWALIAGYGTNRQVGGSAYYTRISTDDFDLDTFGAAVGFHDRVELSVARQKFDAGSVVPGLELEQDVFGAKVKVFGDAVYDQDSPWPQVSVGLMHKRNTNMTVPSAIGATRSKDTDIYVSATKVWLAGMFGRNALATLTLRATRANQLGLLGFGGDRKDSRSLQPELSAAVLLTDNLALGAEHRWKPDNLSAFKEEDFSDVFVAWFPHRNVAITGAWARLGTVAGKKKQDGAYLSIQLTM
ncbi:MAG TPA: DUF3034 family protein [Usitatibacter sp.]|nr:DUF3034 family protein [Usitatibacter sp.]